MSDTLVQSPQDPVSQAGKLTFIDRINQAVARHQSLLCVGLDPDPSRFPLHLQRSSDGIWQFNRAIVDATRDLVCAFKPQIAHYAAHGAETQLKQTIDYIHSTTDVPVILDAKRGDIGSTASHYAEEAFERYGADAVTVNPFLGLDSIEPFLSYADKGVILLCRTSNPGGADLQNLVLESGEHLYEHIARLASTVWNSRGNVLLVVGATRPEELRRIREIVGALPLLIPGIGAQGGDIEATMTSAKGGLVIVNSSRAILYASQGENYAASARAAAIRTRDDINRHR